MSKLALSLVLGCAAGIIDIIPMLIQRLDRYAIVSAFVQWVVLGILIVHCDLKLRPWLSGLVVAELAAIPIVILVAKNDLESVPIILSMTALLGAAVGYFAMAWRR